MAQVAPNQGSDVMDLGILSLSSLNPDLNNDGKLDPWESEVYGKLMAADTDKDGELTRQELFSVMRDLNAAVKNGIPLSALDPDTDGDGKIEEWEKEVYTRIVAADTDKSGAISVRNLYDFIRLLSNEVKEAAKGGIPISTLNPDTDGDGKVEKWEIDVFERIKDADADQSGSINVKELFGVIKGAAESDRQKKLFKRLFIAAVLIILALIGAMLGMGIVAGEAVKESRVPDCSDPTVTDARCNPGNVVRAGQVESFSSIFDLPAAPTEQLAYLRDVTFYVDMTAHPSVNGPVEATFKVAGAYKRSTSECTLVTTNGYSIALDATSRTGSIAMDGGASYPVSETAPAAGSGRRLETADTPMMPTLTAKQLAQNHYNRRKLFSGALMTSGSFTMMAAGGGDRRQLFSGALMTSGSYTMMAAGGGDV